MKLLVVGWSVISDLCTFSPASHLGLMVSLCLGDWIPFQHADEVGGRSQAAPPLAPQWGCQMRTNMFNSSFYRSFKRLVVLQLWTGWLCLPTQSHWIRLIGIKKDAAKPCYSCAREVSAQSTSAVKLLAQKLVTLGSFFWSPKKSVSWHTYDASAQSNDIQESVFLTGCWFREAQNYRRKVLTDSRRSI